MFEGLPALIRFIVDGMMRDRYRGSGAIVVYHLLGDVVNATDHALTHYLPLELAHPCLQNSSFGSPRGKWAKFTNDDFETVDQCVRRLLPVAWNWYGDEGRIEGPRHHIGFKDAWYWMSQVRELYASCSVDPVQPTLTLSVLHLQDWIDSERSRFRAVHSEPSFVREGWPPIVTKTRCDIVDHGRVLELQRAGFANLQALRSSVHRFGAWLRANSTLADVTAPHAGSLSESCLG